MGEGQQEEAKVYAMREEGKSWAEIAATFEGKRTDNHVSSSFLHG